MKIMDVKEIIKERNLVLYLKDEKVTYDFLTLNEATLQCSEADTKITKHFYSSLIGKGSYYQLIESEGESIVHKSDVVAVCYLDDHIFEENAKVLVSNGTRVRVQFPEELLDIKSFINDYMKIIFGLDTDSYVIPNIMLHGNITQVDVEINM
jgi:hypothetical protein